MIARVCCMIGFAACSGPGASPSPPSPAPAPAERTVVVSQLPICRSGADLAHLDGKRVRLVGTYRKRMVPKKQGRPATEFYGQAQIELTGKATDYDPSAWEGALAIVSLGIDKRPAAEIEQFADQPVAIEGRLVLQPPPDDPSVASAMRPPTLFDLGPISTP
jgi:hypothetical protein